MFVLHDVVIATVFRISYHRSNMRNNKTPPTLFGQCDFVFKFRHVLLLLLDLNLVYIKPPMQVQSQLYFKHFGSEKGIESGHTLGQNGCHTHIFTIGIFYFLNFLNENSSGVTKHLKIMLVSP